MLEGMLQGLAVPSDVSTEPTSISTAESYEAHDCMSFNATLQVTRGGGGSLFGCRAFGNSFGCMLNMTARGNGGSPQPRLITLKPCLMGSCCPGGNPARLVPCGDSLGCHIQQWRCSRAMGNNTLRPDNRLCRLDSPWVCIMSLTTPKMDPHHCGCCG